MKKLLLIVTCCINLWGVAQENETYQIKRSEIEIYIIDSIKQITLITPQATYLMSFSSVEKYEEGIIFFGSGYTIVISDRHVSLTEIISGDGVVWWWKPSGSAGLRGW